MASDGRSSLERRLPSRQREESASEIMNVHRRLRSFAAIPHSLTVRLLGSVLLFSACVTLILTVLQLYVEYRQDVAALELRLDQISKTNLESLAERLWALDENQLRLQLTGILQLPGMRAVEVREAASAGEPLDIKLGEKSPSSTITREYPLLYNMRGQNTRIGTLYVQATLADIRHRLSRTAGTIFVNKAAETLLVALFIVYIFHNLVTRHLFAIATFVDGYRINEPTSPLRLQRPPRRHEDELQRVATAFNALSDNLQRAYRSLREREARIRRLIDAGIIGVFLFDIEGPIFEANDAFLSIVGYDREDLVSGRLRWTDLTPPEWRDRDALQLVPELKATGRLEPFEKEYFRKDGSRVPVLIGTATFEESTNQGVAFVLDLTERKQAQEALRRSEAYLSEAQRLSKTGSWALDPEKEKLLHCSEELFRIYGVDLQKGPPALEQLLQRVHPEDRDRVRQLRIKGRERVEDVIDYRLLLPDGTIKNIRSIRHPVFNQAGDIVEFMGTSIDVTEQERAKEALQRSESYLAEAQKLTKTGSLAWDPASGKTLHCSDEVFRMFGLDPQRGIPAIADLLERVHPEDREYVTGRSRKGTDDKAEQVVDYRLLLPDGILKYIHSTRHPILNDAGEVVEFLGTIIDVTEQKRAEETLRRSEIYLAEAQKMTHTGSWAWDPTPNKVLYWSEEMFRIFGFDPLEGIPTGTEFGHRVHPEDHDTVFEYIRNSVTQKRDYLANHRIVLPDGSVRHIETIGHPVLNSSGELVEYVGTAVDITERKHAEAERERLHQMEADLARVNRVSMMGELAASLAHEIKQPIAAAAIDAETSLLWLQCETPDIGEAREAMGRIVKDVNRAADIIDRNRALYRRGTPNREVVNLNELIREMIALLNDGANRNAVSIRTELDGALPAITADRVQIQQVLMNLMLNGIEAMKDTGGELTIKSRKNEDGQVEISVSDLGVGLPVGEIDRIFDAFFTTKTQGTGMGLSISQRVVESHGGRLWAAGNPGRGATFHFSLPGSIPSFTESAALEANHGPDN